MALDARHRSSIYQKLIPLLGDDDANALMSEFPASEADELVTTQHLRAELAQLEMKVETKLAQLGTQLAQLETKLTLRIGAAAVAQTTVTVGLLSLIG